MSELLWPALEIAPWPDDRRFAYSITYDEGLVETLGFAWRLQRDYGFPGHINVFGSRLGRLEGDTSAGFLQSLWNLRKYAEAEQLAALLAEGWSLGCQYDEAPGSRDVAALAAARQTLADALGCAVNSLACAAGTSWQDAADAARSAGFRWLMPVYDDLNPANDVDDVIRRSPLYHLGPAPNRLAADPYRLLAQAADTRGWQVDVVRLVDRYPVDPARDCTPAELERRFRAVREIGAGRAWLADPETVAAYRTGRAATQVLPETAGRTEASWAVRAAPGPDALTFLVTLDPRWQTPRANVGSTPVDLQPAGEPGRWCFTARVEVGQQLRVVWEAA